MRTKLLTVLCMFLMVGLGSTVMAATTDLTGDSCIADRDILEANVEVYNDSGNGPEQAKLYLKMAEGSKLPGYVIWDFDVDQDTATGIDMSVLNMPFTSTHCDGTGDKPAVSGQWHSGEGVDFYIIMALRSQSDTSTMADCGGCVTGPDNCGQRSASACTGCTPAGTYYEVANSCIVGDSDCYVVRASEKSDCTEGNCYALTEPCVATDTCGDGMHKGEWRLQVVAGSKAPARGDWFLPITYTITNETEICVTINWNKCLIKSGAASGAGDTDKAPRFAVSAWYDPDFSDEDDFFDPGMLLNLSDYMPNGYSDFATGTYITGPDCLANYDGDRGVGAGDVGTGFGDPIAPGGFLDEWNKRTPYSDQIKCPACD